MSKIKLNEVEEDLLELKINLFPHLRSALLNPKASNRNLLFIRGRQNKKSRGPTAAVDAIRKKQKERFSKDKFCSRMLLTLSTMSSRTNLSKIR